MIEDWALIVGDGAVTLSSKSGVPGGWRCKTLPSVWSLAMSVNNLANRLGEAGRRAEAQSAADEAARLHGELD